MLAAGVAHVDAQAQVPDNDTPPADGAEADAAAPEPGLTDEQLLVESAEEVIEVTDRAPLVSGAVTLDAEAARTAPGAFGEPIRALALLPGVTTSVSAIGYPIIRGSLPGESRFEVDGIELPMLYHLGIGSQAVHPGFLGGVELVAGGQGAEHGGLLGGLVSLNGPSEPEGDRTELRLTLADVAALHRRRVGTRTSLIVAARAGTLSLVAPLVDSRTQLTYVDQQLRIVHRLGDTDRVTLTSIGAFDYVRTPPEPPFMLGFHRGDLRWERKREHWRARIGIGSEVDVAGFETTDTVGDGASPSTMMRETQFSGGRGYGVRPYADIGGSVTSWLTLRGGLAGRYRRMASRGEPLFGLYGGDRPYLKPAREADSAGVWVAADARVGPVTLTPGVRADTYHAVQDQMSARHGAIDPRVALRVDVTPELVFEAAAGLYSAPPKVTLVDSWLTVGPLPSTDGTGLNAGLSRARQAQLGVRALLPGDLDASATAYARSTRYAVDFLMSNVDFAPLDIPLCSDEPWQYDEYHDRNAETRAMGFEAMLRRPLGPRWSGWLSYSLARIRRRLPIGAIPHDFDQRHTLNAALQLRLGKWTLGSAVHVHTGRPAIYPKVQQCSASEGQDASFDYREDPASWRRLGTAWRVDFRAERAFAFQRWNMRLVLELLNASLTPEQVGYQVDSQGRIVTETFLLPVPMLGVEADF